MFRRSALAFALTLPLCHTATAEPWNHPGRQGPARQACNTTINVYIPNDPAPPPNTNRPAYVAKGFNVWNEDKTLKGKRCKIQFVAKLGEKRPPEDKTGIEVVWSPDKPKVDGEEKVGVFEPKFADNNSAVITGGNMTFWSDPSMTDELIWKVATHEFGHALGLWHSDKKEDVMYDGSSALKLSENDIKEISDTYGKEPRNRKPKIKPSVIKLGQSWEYKYELNWNEGKEISYFEIGIGSATVWDLAAAQGWTVGPHGPTPGSDIDVSKLSAGTFRSVSFRIGDDSAYLGPDNPVLSFSFMADQAPRIGWAWLGGGTTTLAPVPEPATWALWLSGLGLLGVGARARRRVSAGPARLRVGA